MGLITVAVRCRTNLFDNVDARVMNGKKGKCKLVFVFQSKTYPEMTSFTVDGATLMPPEYADKVMATREAGPATIKTLAAIKNIVEGWCALESASTHRNEPNQ